MKKSVCLCLILALGVLMALWFKKRDNFDEFRTFKLPGEIGSVDLPVAFAVEMEDDSTLLAYPQGVETISLRFSSISFTKAGSDELGAKASVRSKAKENGYAYQEDEDKGISSYEEDSEQDGVPLILRFWEVGIKNTIVIVSATIIRKKRNHRRVKNILQIMRTILDSLEVTILHKIYKRHGKEVEATIDEADPTPQTVTPFGKNEVKWLETNLDRARALSLKYGSGGDLDAEELDRIFSRWRTEEGPKEKPDLISNALGAAFGSYFVEHHGFRWKVITDEWGKEYAVRHTVGETTAFPRTSIEKRIEDKQSEFFQSLLVGILGYLEEAKKED